MEKFYTYEDLPDKGKMPGIQYVLTDEIILEYLNNIIKNSNLLESIEYKEMAKSDNEGATVSVTFNLLKKIS